MNRTQEKRLNDNYMVCKRYHEQVTKEQNRIMQKIQK